MGAVTEPILNILGERVALGPLVREHIPLFVRWRNDFAVVRTTGDVPEPTTIEAMTTRFEGRAKGDGTYRFVIYECATWRPIGLTHLSAVEWRGRTATFSITIGEAEARGKGYGTETARLMLDYAFTALGLHSVMLATDGYNLAGQAAYRKAGFKEFGRQRQCSLLDGQLHDVVYMDCLASEFISPVLGRVFVPDTPR